MLQADLRTKGWGEGWIAVEGDTPDDALSRRGLEGHLYAWRWTDRTRSKPLSLFICVITQKVCLLCVNTQCN